MDYEKKMTREEAIEKVRKMSLPKETVEILEALAPELRESDDERIRKALIEVFKEKLERGFEWVEYGIPNRSVLSWLEKQKVEHPKEQNQNIELIQKSWYMEGYHDRKFNKEPKWIIKTGEGGPRYEENPKYGQHIEQKSSEWSEEDKKMLTSIIERGQSQIQMFETGLLPEQINWLKSLKPQPKQEWSKKDEMMLQDLCEELHDLKCGNYRCYVKDIYNEWIAWLKSLPLNLKKKNEDVAKLCSNEWTEEDEEAFDMCLDAIPKAWKTKSGILLTKWLKDNIHPHSKQEWSEEETKDLAHILKVLDDCYAYGKHDLSKTDHDNLTSTIKSLRPRTVQDKFNEAMHIANKFEEGYKAGVYDAKVKSWKPSEEQMEALNALICHGDLSYVGQQNQLISLYDDLKKLM